MLTMAEAASCCGGNIGSAATVCCISGTSFQDDSFVYGSLGVALATVKPCGASFILGAKIDPVAAECAPRSSVVESAEATCVRGADFHPNKPNNLLANESLLSVSGDG